MHTASQSVTMQIWSRHSNAVFCDHLLVLQFGIEQARFYDKCNLDTCGDKTSCQVRLLGWRGRIPIDCFCAHKLSSAGYPC